MAFDVNVEGTANADVIDLSGLSSEFNVTVRGREDNDTISTGAGEDVLRGNKGDDTLNGGEGVDENYGGRGSDAIHFDINDSVVNGGSDSIGGYDSLIVDGSAGTNDFLNIHNSVTEMEQLDLENGVSDSMSSAGLFDVMAQHVLDVSGGTLRVNGDEAGGDSIKLLEASNVAEMLDGSGAFMKTGNTITDASGDVFDEWTTHLDTDADGVADTWVTMEIDQDMSVG